MKNLTQILLISTTCFLSSCVYSLFPIFTEDTLVYESKLEGRWKSGEDGFVEFTPFKGVDLNIEIKIDESDSAQKIKSPDDYKLSAKEEGEQGYLVKFMDNDTVSFRGRLAKVGDNTFLDLYPDESEMHTLENLAYNYFPVHTFMKIEIEKGKIIITQFNLNELNKLFEGNKIRLRHELVDGNVLITAQPKEVQKFLLLYSEDDKVFEKPEVFNKMDS